MKEIGRGEDGEKKRKRNRERESERHREKEEEPKRKAKMKKPKLINNEITSFWFFVCATEKKEKKRRGNLKISL